MTNNPFETLLLMVRSPDLVTPIQVRKPSFVDSREIIIALPLWGSYEEAPDINSLLLINSVSIAKTSNLNKDGSLNLISNHTPTS